MKNITDESAAAVMVCRKTNRVFHINVCENEKMAKEWVDKDRDDENIETHLIPNWKLVMESVKEYQRYNY
jgi:hypothetical protein